MCAVNHRQHLPTSAFITEQFGHSVCKQTIRPLTTGDIPNVVFPCGATLNRLSDELRLYYGAADTSVALMSAQLADVLDWLRTQPCPTASHARSDCRAAQLERRSG